LQQPYYVQFKICQLFNWPGLKGRIRIRTVCTGQISPIDTNLNTTLPPTNTMNCHTKYSILFGDRLIDLPYTMIIGAGGR